MTDIPEAPAAARLPESMGFWLSEARALKDIADQSWKAERNITKRLKSLSETVHERQLNRSMATLQMELNFLYRYLIALAIQHLAIGILITRDPSRFLYQPPRHRIVDLVNECGVTLTCQQEGLLRHTENVLGWRKVFPVNVKRTEHNDSLQELNRILTEMEMMTDEEKTSLEKLYLELEVMAR